MIGDHYYGVSAGTPTIRMARTPVVNRREYGDDRPRYIGANGRAYLTEAASVASVRRAGRGGRSNRQVAGAGTTTRNTRRAAGASGRR